MSRTGCSATSSPSRCVLATHPLTLDLRTHVIANGATVVQRSDGQWEEFVDDESGYKYYYNTATAETLWEWEYQKEYMPEAVVEPQPVAAVQACSPPLAPSRTLLPDADAASAPSSAAEGT
eukprot:2814223-Rhodomonas_salina.1